MVVETEARVRLRQNAKQMQAVLVEYGLAMYSRDVKRAYNTINKLKALADDAADICVELELAEDSNGN